LVSLPNQYTYYLKERTIYERDFTAQEKEVVMHKHLLWEITESQEEEKNIILDKLVNFNRQVLSIAPDKPSSASLNYVIKVENKIIGGINASLYLAQSILHINHLFVDEEYRAQQLGSILLKRVEEEAKAREVKLAHLDTFDWQAKGFYLKHGYEIFGILEGCFHGHERYFLKKNLI
jgi:GNAT superfamily N-acetyltransferase